MGSSPHTVSIHILDDDSLLNVFNLYRPFLLTEDGDNNDLLYNEGRGIHALWWYKLAHVCQRWRNLVLGSAAYLGISLVCMNGTPVADMLAHSPPLPLVIDYTSSGEYEEITVEDEEGAILALKQRNRVRVVHLQVQTSVPIYQNLIAAMDDEYPILEYLIILPPIGSIISISLFPETFQAPHLRRLLLDSFALPIGCRLLTTAVSLVTLCLSMVHPSTYFHPNTLLQWLSFMPQLKTLAVFFVFPIPNRDVEMQLMRTPAMPVPLLNLHILRFQGVTTYLEALVHRIAAPRLKRLEASFFNQLTFSVPRLLQFVNTSENLRFKSAKFEFSNLGVSARVYPDEEAEVSALSIGVFCWHLDWQVSSAAQIFNLLSPMFFAVEHLTLAHSVHSLSSEEHNEADSTMWRKLLGSFRNVKTLRIANGLVEELSRCLQLDDGELPLGLLPELQELTYFGTGDTGDTFTSFIDARQNAGRPITLVRRSPSPDQSSSVSPSAGPPSITSAGDEGSDLNI